MYAASESPAYSSDSPSDDEYVESLRSSSPLLRTSQDHYAVLGLKRHRFQATDKQIRRAYHKKILQHHPDKRSVDEDDHYFTCVNRAWEVLSNPQERRQYDMMDPHAEREQRKYFEMEFPPEKSEKRKRQKSPIGRFFSRFLCGCNNERGSSDAILENNGDGKLLSICPHRTRTIDPESSILRAYLQDCARYRGASVEDDEKIRRRDEEKEKSGGEEWKSKRKIDFDGLENDFIVNLMNRRIKSEKLSQKNEQEDFYSKKKSKKVGRGRERIQMTKGGRDNDEVDEKRADKMTLKLREDLIKLGKGKEKGKKKTEETQERERREDADEYSKRIEEYGKLLEDEQDAVGGRRVPAMDTKWPEKKGDALKSVEETFLEMRAKLEIFLETQKEDMKQERKIENDEIESKYRTDNFAFGIPDRSNEMRMIKTDQPQVDSGSESDVKHKLDKKVGELTSKNLIDKSYLECELENLALQKVRENFHSYMSRQEMKHREKSRKYAGKNMNRERLKYSFTYPVLTDEMRPVETEQSDPIVVQSKESSDRSFHKQAEYRRQLLEIRAKQKQDEEEEKRQEKLKEEISKMYADMYSKACEEHDRKVEKKREENMKETNQEKSNENGEIITKKEILNVESVMQENMSSFPAMNELKGDEMKPVMRCDGMRCDGMRCDGMKPVMRCDELNKDNTTNKNTPDTNLTGKPINIEVQDVDLYYLINKEEHNNPRSKFTHVLPGLKCSQQKNPNISNREDRSDIETAPTQRDKEELFRVNMLKDIQRSIAYLSVERMKMEGHFSGRENYSRNIEEKLRIKLDDKKEGEILKTCGITNMSVSDRDFLTCINSPGMIVNPATDDIKCCTVRVEHGNFQKKKIDRNTLENDTDEYSNSNPRGIRNQTEFIPQKKRAILRNIAWEQKNMKSCMTSCDPSGPSVVDETSDEEQMVEQRVSEKQNRNNELDDMLRNTLYKAEMWGNELKVCKSKDVLFKSDSKFNIKTNDESENSNNRTDDMDPSLKLNNLSETEVNDRTNYGASGSQSHSNRNDHFNIRVSNLLMALKQQTKLRQEHLSRTLVEKCREKEPVEKSEDYMSTICEESEIDVEEETEDENRTKSGEVIEKKKEGEIIKNDDSSVNVDANLINKSLITECLTEVFQGMNISSGNFSTTGYDAIIGGKIEDIVSEQNRLKAKVEDCYRRIKGNQKQSSKKNIETSVNQNVPLKHSEKNVEIEMEDSSRIELSKKMRRVMESDNSESVDEIVKRRMMDTKSVTSPPLRKSHMGKHQTIDKKNKRVIVKKIEPKHRNNIEMRSFNKPVNKLLSPPNLNYSSRKKSDVVIPTQCEQRPIGVPTHHSDGDNDVENAVKKYLLILLNKSIEVITDQPTTVAGNDLDVKGIKKKFGHIVGALSNDGIKVNVGTLKLTKDLVKSSKENKNNPSRRELKRTKNSGEMYKLEYEVEQSENREVTRNGKYYNSEPKIRSVPLKERKGSKMVFKCKMNKGFLGFREKNAKISNETNISKHADNSDQTSEEEEENIPVNRSSLVNKSPDNDLSWNDHETHDESVLQNREVPVVLGIHPEDRKTSLEERCSEHGEEEMEYEFRNVTKGDNDIVRFTEELDRLNSTFSRLMSGYKNHPDVVSKTEENQGKIELCFKNERDSENELLREVPHELHRKYFGETFTEILEDWVKPDKTDLNEDDVRSTEEKNKYESGENVLEGEFRTNKENCDEISSGKRSYHYFSISDFSELDFEMDFSSSSNGDKSECKLNTNKNQDTSNEIFQKKVSFSGENSKSRDPNQDLKNTDPSENNDSTKNIRSNCDADKIIFDRFLNDSVTQMNVDNPVDTNASVDKEDTKSSQKHDCFCLESIPSLEEIIKTADETSGTMKLSDCFNVKSNNDLYKLLLKGCHRPENNFNNFHILDMQDLEQELRDITMPVEGCRRTNPGETGVKAQQGRKDDKPGVAASERLWSENRLDSLGCDLIGGTGSHVTCLKQGQEQRGETGRQTDTPVQQKTPSLGNLDKIINSIGYFPSPEYRRWEHLLSIITKYAKQSHIFEEVKHYRHLLKEPIMNGTLEVNQYDDWSSNEDEMFDAALKRNLPAPGVWEEIAMGIPNRSRDECVRHFAVRLEQFEEAMMEALNPVTSEGRGNKLDATIKDNIMKLIVL